MLTLQKFERLIEAPLATKPINLSLIGQSGEHILAWSSALTRLDKHEQYRQIKTVLSELTVAQISDETRFTILKQVSEIADRLVARMHGEYINNPQSQNLEQKTCMEEVRSLYFLLVLGFLGIANRSYEELNQEGLPVVNSAKAKAGWLTKLTGGLSGNVVINGANINVLDKTKVNFTLSVWYIVATCYKLLFEFALSYQKAPESIWKILNAWYLKSATMGVDRLDVSKMSDLKNCSINHQYIQCCAVSFANFFAYRRADIANIFRIFPEWAKLTTTSFIAEKHHRIFINLQSNNPPEIITPHASVNPYSGDVVCLFFDIAQLFKHLTDLNQQEKTDGKTSFEGRLAKMLLLAFDRESESTFMASKISDRSADILMGFGSIFREMAEHRSFNQVIAQSKLPEEYRPKRVFEVTDNYKKERAWLLRTSESGGKFILNKGNIAQADEDVSFLTRPYLSVFTLFALKMPKTTNNDAWRLGIIYWVQDRDDGVEVDGKFLGRVLSVCGVRLSGHDMRSKDFVQAFLVADDGLSQQTTLILPRYHFKVGDTVILRVGENQTTLRLERNVLSTDDIEQYQIVRLS